MSFNDTNKVIDINYSYVADGSAITLYTYNGGTNQKWILNHDFDALSEMQYNINDPGSPITKVYKINWNNAADSATNFLLNNFWSANNSYYKFTSQAADSFSYLSNSIALNLLLDNYYRSQSANILNNIQLLKAGIKSQNSNTYLHTSNTNMGYTALAFLKSYTITNDISDLQIATDLWNHIKLGWQNDNIAGIIKDSINSPTYRDMATNGTACIIAAKVFTYSHNTQDSTMAVNLYNFLKTNLLQTSGAVYDGIYNSGQSNNSTSSLTQGMMLGAAIEMYKLTNNNTYLNDAISAANYSLNNATIISFEGIIKGASKGITGFNNGIFIQNITKLISTNIPDTTRIRYVNFVKTNAMQFWLLGVNKTTGLFNTYWKNPLNNSNLTQELPIEENGVLLMESAAYLKNENYF